MIPFYDIKTLAGIPLYVVEKRIYDILEIIAKHTNSHIIHK